MIVSLWRIPADELPGWPLPLHCRPWITRGRSTLITFWVDYRGESVIAYHEFLIAQVIRHGRRLTASAVAAWVDDERALHGGRVLWGVPKELATIILQTDASRTDAELFSAGSLLVRAVHRTGLLLPLRVPARAHLVQQLPDGATCRVSMEIRGRPGVGRTRVMAVPSALTAFLQGRRPRLSLTVHSFRGTFGRDS
ncbi:acetoacetate decarboxylase family protein [Kitasatospora sp. NPDC058046]|uniref:acetoacetate decarboxylase family protein n=1 Tax=Kitasatospora sp. NPDC058046 TaxID=3346312 RepID=UPI0036DCB0DB